MADVYTSGSGDWISPGNGFVNIKLRGTGGGGAAGEAGGGDRAGSGGGGGAYCEVIALPVTIGQSVAYSIGTPGIGGTYDNDDATAGTATTADGGTYSAGGGGKGGFGGGAAGGAGGTASGGDINTSGAAGSVNPTSTTGGAGGAGANSGGSGGVGGDPGNQLAGDGTDPGGGGGGGGDNGSFGGGDTADGGGGGGGSATFDFTAGALVSSEILRPIAGLEEDAGDSFWNLIDDVVTQPTTPGDLSYMSIPHGVTQKFKVAAPTPGYTIISARLWILAHAEFDIAGVTEFKIFIVKIKLNGSWYDLGVVNQKLTTTPTWYWFDLPSVFESTDSDDIGFEWTVTDPFGPYSGQYARMDVAYLELSYPPIEYSGYGPVSGTDEFYGVGARTFEGYGSLSGTGDFSGTGTQPARGYGWVIGTDDFSGVGRVPDSGYGPVTGTGYFYGVGRLPDSGYGSVSGAGVLSGTGSVPASSAVVRLRRAGIMGEW